MDYSSDRNYGCRILEYTHRGLKFISMENELIKIAIIVDKGADISELIYKPKDIDFMWKSPGGIREAGKFVSTTASAYGNFSDYYEGGWQEILPGGGPCTYMGAELGLHGEVSIIPWGYYVEKDTAQEISIVLSCRTNRFPFYIKKIISLKSNKAVIETEEYLTNESNEEIEFLWSQHPSYGAPFLDASCRIDIPAKEFSTSDFYNSPTALFKPEHKGTWPIDTAMNGNKVDLSKVPSGEEPVSDLYYIKGLDEGWYALTNTNMKLGIGFCWDISVFPYMTYWQVCKGSYGYPWYGRTYNISLEMWNSYTDKYRTAKANGTIKKIKGYETINTAFKTVIYEGLEKVNCINKEGHVE